MAGVGTVSDDGVARRMREAFELYDLGLAMMRQNLRRQYPGDSEASIEQRLLDWRLHRPDAPFGDAEGRVVPFPRPRS
jgi:hypothetical protein